MSSILKYHFNPRSPWGERPYAADVFVVIPKFQSTLSVRRATKTQSKAMLQVLKFQSTLSVRRATCYFILRVVVTIFQSTLSVRRATGRGSTKSSFCGLFQSTLSVRRATEKIIIWCKYKHISIHALREESDVVWGAWPVCRRISIHALREESDAYSIPFAQVSLHFNPRSPWGERRQECRQLILNDYISIHALREESDAI